MEIGKVYIIKTTYQDSKMQLGDLNYCLPIYKTYNGHLCFTTRGVNGISDLCVHEISKNKWKSKFVIEHGGSVEFLGELLLTPDYAKNMANIVYRHLGCGMRGTIVNTLVMIGAIKYKKYEQYLNIEDLIDKGACADGLKWWIKKFGRDNVLYNKAIANAPAEYAGWLQGRFYKSKPTEEQVKQEDIVNFILSLVKKHKKTRGIK